MILLLMPLFFLHLAQLAEDYDTPGVWAKLATCYQKSGRPQQAVQLYHSKLEQMQVSKTVI